VNLFFKSIRWRLQLWYGVIFAVLVSGFGVTAYQLERARQLRQVDDELRQRVGIILQEMNPPPRGEGEFRGPRDRKHGPEPSDAGETEMRNRGVNPPGGLRLDSRYAGLFDENGTPGYYYVVWRRDGLTLARATHAPAESTLPSKGDVPGAPTVRMRGIFREAYQFTPPGECVLAGRSIAGELADFRRSGWKLTGIGATVLLLGLAGGWWIATRAIAPINEISATAVKIAAGDLSQRINAANTDNELGQVASVLNSTFERLEAAFAQQARFTSDAAHELRTPVSVILTHTQGALARERDATEYKETLEACQRAAQRMRRLIELLLELARMDTGELPMKRMRFDLSKVARDCLELVGPLAAERGITLHCESKALECEGDPDRLGQVITNLVSNAIHYNKERGEVRVSTHELDGAAVLTVADTGKGISAEDLPHVFERFYRGDKSRTGAGGRTGLGLAISKAIVDAHGGSLELTSQPGVGTTATLRLRPRAGLRKGRVGS
jgi:two-component system OmpR family sensor kinase